VAEDGQIIISETVYEALFVDGVGPMSHARFVEMGLVALKGIAVPKRLYCTQISRPPLVA